MKTAIRSAILGALCATASVLAQTDNGELPRRSFEPAAADAPPLLNRSPGGCRLGFTLHADFKNLGGFPAMSNPGTTEWTTDHFYDDGFNRVDISTNAGHLTWYWGYNSTNQIVGEDTLVMSSSS